LSVKWASFLYTFVRLKPQLLWKMVSKFQLLLLILWFNFFVRIYQIFSSTILYSFDWLFMTSLSWTNRTRNLSGIIYKLFQRVITSWIGLNLRSFCLFISCSISWVDELNCCTIFFIPLNKLFSIKIDSEPSMSSTWMKNEFKLIELMLLISCLCSKFSSSSSKSSSLKIISSSLLGFVRRFYLVVQELTFVFAC
jgi:hypothetical protein